MEVDSKAGCAIGSGSLPHGSKSCAEPGACYVCLDGELLKTLSSPHDYVNSCCGAK